MIQVDLSVKEMIFLQFVSSHCVSCEHALTNEVEVFDLLLQHLSKIQIQKLMEIEKEKGIRFGCYCCECFQVHIGDEELCDEYNSHSHWNTLLYPDRSEETASGRFTIDSSPDEEDGFDIPFPVSIPAILPVVYQGGRTEAVLSGNVNEFMNRTMVRELYEKAIENNLNVRARIRESGASEYLIIRNYRSCSSDEGKSSVLLRLARRLKANILFGRCQDKFNKNSCSEEKDKG